MSTIKDVARRANVSVTTVSRVLNNNGYVHQDTKKIIEEAMNELKYSPNIFAINLSKGETQTIGIIVNYITNPNSSKLIDLIEKECNKNSLRILIGITRESKAMEDYYFDLFKKYNVKGIIIADKLNNISKFQSLNKPIVTIDHTVNDLSSIKVNYLDGINKTLEQFIKEERKNVLILTYENKTDEFSIKLQNSLELNNINTKIIELIEDYEKEELYTILSEIEFDAIYTTCDIIAISTVSILNKLKIKVPEQCSVIGSSNSTFTSMITPSLTAIDYPANEIALSAFNIIYNNINNNENNVIHKTIDIDLIKRESTK